MLLLGAANALGLDLGSAAWVCTQVSVTGLPTENTASYCAYVTPLIKENKKSIQSINCKQRLSKSVNKL